MIQQNVDQPTLTASDSNGRANSNPYHYVPAGTGPVYRSPVDQVRFLITGEQSGEAGVSALIQPAVNRSHII